MKTLIIGGVAGGASAAARLRRMDEKAEIIMLERGEYISYANCGLPYYIGGVIESKKAIDGQAPKDFSARFNIDVRTRHEALELDIAMKTVRVKNHITGEEYTEAYDALLLAPGAESVRPSLPGVDDKRVFTLRTVPDAQRIHDFVAEQTPKTAVVVGGGFIGLEMAENLSLRGIQVSVVEKADHLLPPLDADMAFGLHRYLLSKGIKLHLRQSVQGFTVAQDGTLMVDLEASALSADMVIMSVGVRAESTLARAAGLALDERGAILVDEQMRTSSPSIYAVGDVVTVKNMLSGMLGQVPLAGPANKQGRIAADNIVGVATKYKGAQGSAIAKIFDLSVAVTGLNEASANAAGYVYDKIYTSSLAHAAYYPDAGKINLKVLFERETGRLLGAQVLGFEGVDKRCDVLATAMRAGMTVTELSELDLCYAPPYGTAKDPINMVGYAAENLMSGLVKQYYWEDVQALQTDASVVLLDVRALQEYAKDHIEGSVNIPLNELRGRMGELDKLKPVYIVCQSGLRSYIASRMLTQNGFQSYSLAGGYQLYQDATAPLDGATLNNKKTEAHDE